MRLCSVVHGGVRFGRPRLEGLERRHCFAAERPDERAVVVVRDLPRPVVELELLERSERAVPLLQETLATLDGRLGTRPGCACRKERARDEEDAGGNEHSREDEAKNG